jgi:hypothetical protein
VVALVIAGVLPLTLRARGDEAIKAGVLGLIHDTHPAAAEFLNDAIVRDGLADHGVEVW